ncbi:MAG: ABC transporter ATP-binding protein [Alphaproteobacteria bacterium]
MLRVERLNAWFGKSHIIRDVSFAVMPGTLVGLLGRNGVGKTTTLKAVMGLVPAREGLVELGGESIGRLSADRIARKGIGYVPQGRQLFPHLTIYENLKLAWHGRNFDDAALERGIGHFPPLRDLLRRLAGTLSGGEQQMVAIGRALLNEPRVVLLDEPSEGLSPLYVDKVRDVLLSLRDRGLAILVVEQNLRLALSICQTVNFMEKGTVVYTCPVEEARDGRVVERYLGVRVT